MKKNSVVLAVTMTVLLGSLTTYSNTLVQYWTFDDGAGTTASNAVYGGNAGTLVNFASTGWDADRPAALEHSTGSLAFSSNDTSYVNGGALGLSATGTVGEVTLSFWIKPQTLGDTRLLSQLEKSPSKNPSGSVQINSTNFRTGTLQVFSFALPGYIALSPVGAISTGVWQHVALTWHGDQATCYIGGNSVGLKMVAFDFDRDTAGNILTFGIGAKFKSQYGSTFNGKMDDLAIWNKVLSSSQIRQIANGRSPLLLDLPTEPKRPPQPLAEYRMDGNAYHKNGSYHGVATNGATFIAGAGNTPFSYTGNMALQLDGVNDEVMLPNVSELSPRTNAWALSLWFKAAAANQQGVLIANRQAAAPYTQIGITIGGSVRGQVGQGRLIHMIALGTLGNNNRWEASTTNVYADGGWHHLVMTRSRNAFAPDVYVDGELVPLDVLDYPSAPTDVNSAEPWRIGSSNVPGYYFKGLIDEVAMWNTDLSAEQVAWLAQNSLAALPLQGTVIMLQ